MNGPDLAGLRVVVTRSEQQAGPLITAVERAGGKPIALPLLAIVDAADGGVALRSALKMLGSDDWLAVLSPNAAHRVLDAGRGAFSLAVVGEGTAKVFAQTGWNPEIVPAEESAAGLLAEFPPAGGGRVVIAQAASGQPTLADGLRSVGWQVEVVVAYQNVLPEVGDEAVARARSAADVVVFASPSAVMRYVDLVGVHRRGHRRDGCDRRVQRGRRGGAQHRCARRRTREGFSTLTPKARPNLGRRSECERAPLTYIAAPSSGPSTARRRGSDARIQGRARSD